MDTLRAIGDRDLRAILLFVRSHGDAVTADDLASAQGIHRNVARARLERLAEAGLLVPAFERRTGRRGPGAGRPAKTYRVAPETSALEFPRRYYERLVGLFAEALPDSTRSARLHEIGLAFGAELARQAGVRRTRRFARALERVCSALGRLGYHASLTEVDGDRAVITTATCPLRPVVRTDPQLTGLDRGMWAGLLEAALGPSNQRKIVCDTTSCVSDTAECRVHLLLRG
jgi:predicted ArsR family transcriptional regulator